MQPSYLTPELPGTGGVLRHELEDFQVDELPLYDAAGEGEHVYVRIRKRGISTFEAVRRIAGALDVPEGAIGYAGLKDARAVATQWLSIRLASEERARALAVPRIEVLEVTRHENKLRLGHLRGNRFAIVVRDAIAAARAVAVLDVLVRRGAPNYFGEQRFGSHGTTHVYGEALLRGDYEKFVKTMLGGPAARERDGKMAAARELFDAGRLDDAYKAIPMHRRAEKKCLHALLRFDDAERACFAIPRRMRQVYVSSFQSSLFNKILDARTDTLDRIEAGDIAYVHRSTKVFPVEDVAAEQLRCTAFEISPSGPLFGTRAPFAEGEPGRRERALLEEMALEPRDFNIAGGLKFKGMRRPLRICLKEVEFTPLDKNAYRIEFVLPGGCFATTVLREIMKP